jgi:hypothetical protein
VSRQMKNPQYQTKHRTKLRVRIRPVRIRVKVATREKTPLELSQMPPAFLMMKRVIQKRMKPQPTINPRYQKKKIHHRMLWTENRARRRQ